MKRSPSGQRDKVRRAREVVGAALGESGRQDYPPPPTLNSVALWEAATRLEITTSEMTAMVAKGSVKALVPGWTTVIPSTEVQRLRAT
ncbi:MAG TPA: hypothetical protein VGU71_21665 [Candidatus Dormibacteraeota bacterium]|nr:hypothetical protein [Candidatus Dormibacteraeota bacterium]